MKPHRSTIPLCVERQDGSTIPPVSLVYLTDRERGAEPAIDRYSLDSNSKVILQTRSSSRSTTLLPVLQYTLAFSRSIFRALRQAEERLS